jgi:hypothetical protein
LRVDRLGPKSIQREFTVVDRAVRAVNLRRIAGELIPNHRTSERLRAALRKKQHTAVDYRPPDDELASLWVYVAARQRPEREGLNARENGSLRYESPL